MRKMLTSENITIVILELSFPSGGITISVLDRGRVVSYADQCCSCCYKNIFGYFKKLYEEKHFWRTNLVSFYISRLTMSSTLIQAAEKETKFNKRESQCFFVTWLGYTTGS